MATMSSVGSFAAPRARVVDNKAMTSAEKFSSFASMSPTSLIRRQNVVLRKSRSTKINAMAKELYFNKDGSAIKKLQVTCALFIQVVREMFDRIALEFELILFGCLFVSRMG